MIVLSVISGDGNGYYYFLCEIITGIIIFFAGKKHNSCHEKKNRTA